MATWQCEQLHAHSYDLLQEARQVVGEKQQLAPSGERCRPDVTIPVVLSLGAAFLLGHLWKVVPRHASAFITANSDGLSPSSRLGSRLGGRWRRRAGDHLSTCPGVNAKGVEPCAQQRLDLVVVPHSTQHDDCGLIGWGVLEAGQPVLLPKGIEFPSRRRMEWEGHVEHRRVGLVLHQVTDSPDLALAPCPRKRLVGTRAQARCARREERPLGSAASSSPLSPSALTSTATGSGALHSASTQQRLGRDLLRPGKDILHGLFARFVGEDLPRWSQHEIVSVVPVGGEAVPGEFAIDGEGALQLLRHQLEGAGLKGVPVGHEDDLKGLALADAPRAP